MKNESRKSVLLEELILVYVVKCDRETENDMKNSTIINYLKIHVLVNCTLTKKDGIFLLYRWISPSNLMFSNIYKNFKREANNRELGWRSLRVISALDCVSFPLLSFFIINAIFPQLRLI